MKEFIDKIKHIFSSEKKTENLIIALVLLVVLFIAANYILIPDSEVVVTNSNNISIESIETTETKLEKILGKISGISDVSVMINYSTTDKVIPVYDLKENIDEEKSDGKISTTSVTEKSVAYQDGENGKVPIVESTELATAEGAIVVASGVSTGNNISKVKEAVSCITGIPIHKISVFEK